jgi:signal transduction histidine kinase
MTSFFAFFAFLLISMPALADDALVMDFTVPLLAAGLGAACVLGYRFLRSHFQDNAPDEDKSRIALLFSSANTYFYYQNLNNQKEWFSRKLKTLLEIKGKNTTFLHFADVLDERDFERLKQAIVDLKAGSKQFRLELKTLSGLTMECYGTIKQEHSTNHLILWWQDISERNESNDRLRKENERMKLELQQLNNMVNALPMPIWQRNAQLQIRSCNLAFMEAAEETPDSQNGDSLELYNQAKILARRALETKQKAHERRYIILHGERKLYDLYEIPWADGLSTTGVGIDNSDMDSVRAEMEQLKSAQADLLESSTSAMAIYGPDQRLRSYNNAFCRLWKLEGVWLETHPKYSEVLEQLRENRALPEQANFPAFKQQHLKLFTDLIDPQEEFYYLPDGRTIRVLAIPHTMGGVLFVYEDVTDRLALERSYNTLIAVQNETLDNLHEGVAVFSEDGRLRLSNPVYMQMWNHTREITSTNPHISDLLNRNKALFVFEDWERFKNEFMAMMSGREVRQQRLERRDGKVLEIIAVPLPDGQTLINYVDITNSILVERSLRERNEALHEADRLKSEFLANISYELRSPLTSISGFTEMLRQDYFGRLTERQQEYLTNIHDASKHLTSLINDILDIASIEAGYMQLEIKSFGIYEVVHSMPSLVGERARQQNITLSLECDAKIGTMEGDENRIRQVLFNLLTNSIKYTENKGKVILGAKDVGKEVVFWVEDNGMGIAPEDQDSVFSKFYRTAGASRKHSGTGLGLSMVKSFVELHGGRVELSSSLQMGTKIYCYFPRKSAINAAPTLQELKHA